MMRSPTVAELREMLHTGTPARKAWATVLLLRRNGYNPASFLNDKPAAYRLAETL